MFCIKVHKSSLKDFDLFYTIAQFSRLPIKKIMHSVGKSNWHLDSIPSKDIYIIFTC